MIDLEFRLRATRPERFQALQFRDVGDSVLYRNLSKSRIMSHKPTSDPE
jgi:hypothetical protein